LTIGYGRAAEHAGHTLGPLVSTLSMDIVVPPDNSQGCGSRAKLHRIDGVYDDQRGAWRREFVSQRLISRVTGQMK
jgi:hypothetical protein